MLLFVVTMDNKGHCRPFSCETPKLETALEALSGIAGMGDLVVSVELLDNGQRTALPSEAFDGKPIAPHIEKLEAEWTAILSKPIGLQSEHNRILTDASSQLRESYQSQINQLECAIGHTESRIQQIRGRIPWESQHVHLELLLTKYRWQLDQARTGLHRLCQRLGAYVDGE